MKTAFIFPGQGSQSVGMGKDLARRFQAAREVFAEADEALGFSLSALCFEGPEGDLQLTENTQPAVLTCSIACLRVIEGESGLRPEIYAGHSLGEYTALVAAGSMDFQDAVRAVRARGRFMQEAVPPGEGAMVAIIGLEKEEVESVCDRAAGGEVLAPANFNAPGQIVVSGHADAVGRDGKGGRSAGCNPAEGKRSVSLLPHGGGGEAPGRCYCRDIVPDARSPGHIQCRGPADRFGRQHP